MLLLSLPQQLQRKFQPTSQDTSMENILNNEVTLKLCDTAKDKCNTKNIWVKLCIPHNTQP